MVIELLVLITHLDLEFGEASIKCGSYYLLLGKQLHFHEPSQRVIRWIAFRLASMFGSFKLINTDP